MPADTDNIVQYLHGAIQSAGLPVIGVGDNGEGTTPRFRVDLDPIATPAQQTQADSIAASFDASPAAVATYRTQADRAVAKGILAGTDANSKALRAALMVAYASIVETRAMVNQIVTYVNAHGGTLTPLVNRTWAQVVTATNQQVDSGQADR